MFRPCEPSPLDELAAIENIPDRIDLVAEDLASGDLCFRGIEAWKLAELLGLDLDDSSRWPCTYWVRRNDPDRDFAYPCAESTSCLDGRHDQNEERNVHPEA